MHFPCADHLVHPHPHQAAAASVVGMPLLDYDVDYDVGVRLAVVVGQEHLLLLNLDLGPVLVGDGVSCRRWLEC